MTDFEFENRMDSDLKLIEKALTENLPACRHGQDSVVEAMRYSLKNGGKRLRPIFCLEFAKCCGAEAEDALAFGCALEYVHTYSLIHDDLPCMDNDDFRRGKPSCHKQFGEATALLAGDALLTHAFEIIAYADLSTDQKAAAATVLAKCAGVGGMIGGQVIDLKYESENPTLSQLLDVHTLKTGALISAACQLGCIAGNATFSQLEAAKRFAENLGIAFQIKDDILDVIGDSAVLGKPVGSDAENDKTTYVTLVGIEQSQKDVEAFTAEAIRALDAFENNDFLIKLAEMLTDRVK